MPIKKILLLSVFLVRAAVAGDDLEIKRLYDEKHYKELLDRFKSITEGRATNAGYSLGEIASAKFNIGSAAQGFADAEYQLGEMYDAGEGVKQDHDLARTWRQKAAVHREQATKQ